MSLSAKYAKLPNSYSYVVCVPVAKYLLMVGSSVCLHMFLVFRLFAINESNGCSVITGAAYQLLLLFTSSFDPQILLINKCYIFLLTHNYNYIMYSLLSALNVDPQHVSITQELVPVWCNVRDRYHCSDCDIYSWFCRYTGAAAKPKSVLILLDTSGSMTGLRLEIAKTTVKKIMESLQENDFFNLIAVSPVYLFLLYEWCC